MKDLKLEFKGYKGKPDKQRLIDAMLGKPVDRVPNMEALIEDKIVEKILGRHVGGGTLGNMHDKIDKEELSKAKKTFKDIEIKNTDRPIYAKDFIEINEAIGQDALRIGEFSAPFLKRDFFEDGKLVEARDKSFKNREDIKKNLILPTENMNYFMKILPYLNEYKKEAKKKNMAVILACGDLFQQLYEFVFGIENFSYLLYDDYSLIEELLEAGVAYWTNFTKYFVKEEIDIIGFSDDIAYKSGLLVKYDIFKKLYLDKYKKVIEPVANAGIPIWFHSDGCLYEVIDDLIEMGINCLNPIEPYSMDYKYLKKKYGKNLTLLGNISQVLLYNGTPEEIKKDVKEHMDVLKPGYRYICASSHSLCNYMPDENIVAFFDSIHEYGVY